ncbi:MAG: hypothetical protein Q4F74_00355 [Synergistaceae bacterium]|nr:hypothetical protein [Synergistaceae bacterium]
MLYKLLNIMNYLRINRLKMNTKLFEEIETYIKSHYDRKPNYSNRMIHAGEAKLEEAELSILSMCDDIEEWQEEKSEKQTFSRKESSERGKDEESSSDASASTEPQKHVSPASLSYDEPSISRKRVASVEDIKPRAMSCHNTDFETFIKRHQKPIFRDLLFSIIDKHGERDSTVYKRALVDRRVFSKIRTDEKYHPSKVTVIALALALKLSKSDTAELLEYTGYALSRSSTFDLLIAFCIEREIFNLFDVNMILDYFHEPLLNNYD